MTMPADPDGINETLALIQGAGLLGYGSPPKLQAANSGKGASASAPEDAAIFALVRDSGLPGYDSKRLVGQS